MIGSTWTYEIGSEKVRELRSSLGMADGSSVPISSVFAYAIVPGITRALIDPLLAPRRANLRLVSVALRWGAHPQLHEELDCSIDVNADGLAMVKVESEGQHRVTAMIRLDGAAPDPPALTGAVLGERTVLDAGRALAFAAATWDLNPAYWNPEFARSVGLDHPVTPPGLSAAWLLEAVRRSAGEPISSATIGFGRTSRVGEEVTARVSYIDEIADFMVTAGDQPACWGSCSLGSSTDPHGASAASRRRLSEGDPHGASAASRRRLSEGL